MGCEAHPDTAERIFKCSGDPEIVFDPCYVETSADNGVVVKHPHWNGTQAFGIRVDSSERRAQTPEAEGMAAVTIAGLRRVS